LKEVLEIQSNEIDNISEIKEESVKILKEVVHKWISEIAAKQKDIPEDRLDQVGGDLLIFGSFKLKTHSS